MIIVQIGTNTGAWDNNGVLNYDSCLKFTKENYNEIDFIHLVEPIKECNPFIEKYYDFIEKKKIYNVAITNNVSDKEITIFRPKNSKTSGHSSYSSNHLFVHGHRDIESILVPSYTLNNFMEVNSIKRCDKLYIDTEGLDCLILMDYDYNKYMTNYIEFEVAHSDGPFNKSINAEKCISKLRSDGFMVNVNPEENLNLIAIR